MERREDLNVCLYLCDLPLVACVCAGAVVSERFGTGEFMVGGGCRDDVALGGDLAGEAGDGAGYCCGGSVIQFVFLGTLGLGTEERRVDGCGMAT